VAYTSQLSVATDGLLLLLLVVVAGIDDNVAQNNDGVTSVRVSRA